MNETILVLGACGQIGTELTAKLRDLYNHESVIASDIHKPNTAMKNEGPFEIIDATDQKAILKIIQKYRVTQVYLMAAMLSATAEKYPIKAWDLNMNSLLNVLELAKEQHIKKVFWPSSIAVFGTSSPKINTPQHTVIEPSTVYGISKVAGEHWCSYYHNKFGVDVRSIRYPGIVSWKTPPGGGTTDYAIDIFFKAVQDGFYDCFLTKDTRLPMMYMDDAINATIQLMNVAAEKLTVRTSYNLAAMSFTPEELVQSIQKHIPNFKITYQPDFRQEIAATWPQIIDDSQARSDWNWQHQFDMNMMTEDMIKNIKNKSNA